MTAGKTARVKSTHKEINMENNEFEALSRKAEQGDAEAQFNLAKRYVNGEGVAEDLGQAFKWYSKAADQGHAEAQFKVGNYYKNGWGVSKDAAKALYWFTKAVEQGHAEAQYSLGFMYYNGEGAQQDAARALYWWTKAAEQGHAGAQFNVGVAYYQGEGTPSDAAKALEWISKAAEQGMEQAKNIINQGDIQKLVKIEAEMKDALAEQYKIARRQALLALDNTPGRTYIANEDYDAAIKEYRNRGDDTGLFEALLLRGFLNKIQGKPSEAIADFEEALKMRPDSVPAQKQLALLKGGQSG
jgi:TPR repeat protein